MDRSWEAKRRRLLPALMVRFCDPAMPAVPEISLAAWMVRSFPEVMTRLLPEVMFAELVEDEVSVVSSFALLRSSLALVFLVVLLLA